MSNLYTITIAFCPASQLARSLIEYKRYHSLVPKKHIVVQGHYPINRQKNNRDIEMVVSSYKEAELWDPGFNMGSAQSQQWVFDKLPDCDYFINWDPDSNCKKRGWELDAMELLAVNNEFVLVSLMSPMILAVMEKFNVRMEEFQDNGIRYGIPSRSIPFNLSLFKAEFIRECGGLKQMGEHWGELEGLFTQDCNRLGKKNIYLLDYMEDESGKFMQDRQLLEYKDALLRTVDPARAFNGSFEEFLELKYPELLALNTEIPNGTIFQ